MEVGVEGGKRKILGYQVMGREELPEAEERSQAGIRTQIPPGLY